MKNSATPHLSMLNKIFFPVIGIGCGAFILFATAFPLKWMILTSVALMGFTLLAVLPNRKHIILFLMIIDTVMLIDTHFFHVSDVLASREGLQLSITTIALGILYTLWWVEIVLRVEKRVEFFPRVTFIALGYLFTCLLSTFNSKYIMMSFFDVFFFTQMFAIFFYIANYIKHKSDVFYIIHILSICLFIQSAVIIIQYIARSQFTLTGDITNLDQFGQYFHEGRLIDVYRPTGTGNSPNEAGGHILMLLPIMLSFVIHTKEYFKRILVWIVVLMGVAALILTFSRGAWASFAVGCMTFLSVALRKRWINMKKVLAMAALAMAIVAFFSVPIAARLSQDDQGAAFARVPLMKLAFYMIRDHPFIGVGVNNFGVASQQYLSSEIRGEWLHLVHNQYLLVFSETGALGLSFFVLLIVTVAHTCIKCLKHNDSFVSSLSLGILSAIIALSLFMTVELSVSRLTVQLFWIITSMAMAIEKFVKINGSPASAPTGGTL